MWIDLIILGVVPFTLGGPPCETWSAARFMELLDGSRGPRPIRSQDSPWGIACLSLREQKQLEIANQLLRAMIRILVVSFSAGAAAVMEHPAIPTWLPHAPSSFLLTELSWLAQQDGVTRTLFDQCTFQAPSVKPTMLLAVHLPRVETVLGAARPTVSHAWRRPWRPAGRQVPPV